MKKLLVCVSLLSAVFASNAQVKADWAVNLDYLFHNSEFDTSNNYNNHSGTVHGVTMTPEFGLSLTQDSFLHKLRLGAVLSRETGSDLPFSDTFREMLIYYTAKKDLGSCKSSESAFGAYPRSFLEGDWADVFFSVTEAYSDPVYEGMCFKYKGNSFYTELALDWNGMYGDDNPVRRERFQVLSYGKWNLPFNLALSWTGRFYHFACAPTALNVVDNHSLRLLAHWGACLGPIKTELAAGALISYQRDRAVEHSTMIPAGFISRQELGYKSLSVNNLCYFGEGQMPLYDQYGAYLYAADRCFDFRTQGPGWADVLSFRWTPHINRYIDAVVSWDFRFGHPVSGIGMYRGTAQFVGFRFNLEKI